MIPGSNLLNMAFRIIAKETLTYFQFVSRSLNSIGQDITVYAPPVEVMGSFQPVPKQLYEIYGLDLQKDYWMFYISQDLLDLNREVSGDQIAFNGSRYQCESATDWFPDDGWKSLLCVRVGLDTPEPAPIWGFNSMPSINSYLNFGNSNFVEVI